MARSLLTGILALAGIRFGPEMLLQCVANRSSMTESVVLAAVQA